MDRTKLITSLVILCLASAVAAFLMPPAHGALLSFVSIASRLSSLSSPLSRWCGC